MIYPPIGLEVVLTGLFGEFPGYWTGDKFLFSSEGEDTVAVDVTGWRYREG